MILSNFEKKKIYFLFKKCSYTLTYHLSVWLRGNLTNFGQNFLLDHFTHILHITF